MFSAEGASGNVNSSKAQPFQGEKILHPDESREWIVPAVSGKGMLY